MVVVVVGACVVVVAGAAVVVVTGAAGVVGVTAAVGATIEVSADSSDSGVSDFSPAANNAVSTDCGGSVEVTGTAVMTGPTRSASTAALTRARSGWLIVTVAAVSASGASSVENAAKLAKKATVMAKTARAV